MQFDHVRLLVVDVGAALAFYRDVMGMSVTFDDGGNYAVAKHTGGMALHLFRRDLMAATVDRADLPPEADAQDALALIFDVDDVDAIAQQLRDRGVELVTEPTNRPDWGIRTVHLRDPDGNLIEVNQALPET